MTQLSQITRILFPTLIVIRGSFVPPPGCKIINVSMEVEKNTGFVTFDKAEAAEAAINQHNGQ